MTNKEILKSGRVEEISGSFISNKTYTFAKAINTNAEVLKELAQYVDKLEQRIEELEKIVR